SSFVGEQPAGVVRVGHVEVQVPVAIVVDPGGRVPVGRGGHRPARHLHEPGGAVVTEQAGWVLLDAHEQVEVAVVVVVAPGLPAAAAAPGKRSGCHVREHVAAVVPEQRDGAHTFSGPADVEVPVPVVVLEGDTLLVVG